MRIAPPPPSLRLLLLGMRMRIAERRRVLALSIIVWALLAASVSTFIGGIASTRERAIADRATLTIAEVQDRVGTTLSSFSEEQMTVFFEDVWQAYRTGVASQDSEASLSILYMATVGPPALALAGLQMTLLFLAYAYFMMVVQRSPDATMADLLRSTPLLAVRMLFLGVWIMLRSFCWVPFFGPFFALWYHPRMLRAPGILASGRAGVLASVRQSIDRSRGQWVPMLGRLLAFVAMTIVVLWCAMSIASIVAVLSPKIGYLLFMAGVFSLQMLVAAFLSEVA